MVDATETEPEEGSWRQWLNDGVTTVRKFCFRMPLVGNLFGCSARHLSHAAIESIVTVIFATVPLWLMTLVNLYLFGRNIPWDEITKSGELLIVSVGLVGPFFYIISKTYGKFNYHDATRSSFLPEISLKFPSGGLLLLISAGVCLVSSGAFAILKNPAISTDFAEQLSVDGLWRLSFFMFTVSTVSLFLVTAYKNRMDTQSGYAVVQEEHNFVARFRSRARNAKLRSTDDE